MKCDNMVLVYLPAVDDDWTRTPPIALVHFPGRGRADRHTDKNLGVNAAEPTATRQINRSMPVCVKSLSTQTPWRQIHKC